ncbi:MAG: SLBB domain-containing protein [Gemmatimonadales bacterium]|nr:SLBB domain-containing protein [Gemmatimonadales bacterium]
MLQNAPVVVVRLRACRPAVMPVVIWLAMCVVGATTLEGQDSSQVVGPVSAKSLLASRDELEDVLSRLKPESNEAILLRERLEQGDFEPNDRLVMRVNGEQSLTDTFTVRTGRLLELPGIGQVSLLGVLRSEAQDVLKKKVATQLRDPEVVVMPLMRLAVVGGVGRPGYFWMPADLVLGDAVMRAGGLSQDSRPDRIKGRRFRLGRPTPLSEMQLRDGLARGLSLDQLNLQSGDELEVGKRGQPWTTYIWPVSLLLGVIATVRSF